MLFTSLPVSPDTTVLMPAGMAQHGLQVWNLALTAAVSLGTLLYTVVTWKGLRATEREHDRDGFLRIVGLMEETRADRDFVRACAERGRHWRDLTPVELQRVDHVCRAFDVLALFDRHGLVDRRLVDEFYASLFVRLYESFLEDYVRDQRDGAMTGKTYFWELVEFYRRVRWVPANHPAYLEQDSWPAEPRRLNYSSTSVFAGSTEAARQAGT